MFEIVMGIDDFLIQLVKYCSDRKKFERYGEALEYAEKLGRQLVMNYMINAGLDKEDIRIDVSKKHQSPGSLTDAPLETKLVFVGIGSQKAQLRFERIGRIGI